MQANIIHTPNRNNDRWPLLKLELKKQGINDWRVWFGEMHKKESKVNISESHKNIVRYAQKTGAKEVLIFENDVMFPAENGFQYFIDNKPEKFDIYLGGIYVGADKLSKSNNIVKRFSGLHCYIVHERFYDTFLELSEEQSLDNMLSEMAIIGIAKIYCCYPMCAIQQELPSDNCNGMIYQHKYFFNTENVYGFNQK